MDVSDCKGCTGSCDGGRLSFERIGVICRRTASLCFRERPIGLWFIGGAIACFPCDCDGGRAPLERDGVIRSRMTSPRVRAWPVLGILFICVARKQRPWVSRRLKSSKPGGVDRHKYNCFGLVRNRMCGHKQSRQSVTVTISLYWSIRDQLCGHNRARQGVTVTISLFRSIRDQLCGHNRSRQEFCNQPKRAWRGWV